MSTFRYQFLKQLTVNCYLSPRPLFFKLTVHSVYFENNSLPLHHCLLSADFSEGEGEGGGGVDICIMQFFKSLNENNKIFLFVTILAEGAVSVSVHVSD